MRTIRDFHPALIADLRDKGVDIDRTLALLDILDGTTSGNTAEAGAASGLTTTETVAVSLPSADDPRIRQRLGTSALRLPGSEARRRLKKLDLPSADDAGAERDGGDFVFTESALRNIGIALYPRVAYGVLNGGSATSYFDEKKNAELDQAAYHLFERYFEELSDFCRTAPKGMTPAFLQANGQMGPSFLLLKMRALLLRALEYRKLTGDNRTGLLPFFQMTSGTTDAALTDAYRDYRNDPLLAPLIDAAGTDPTAAMSAVQPLLAALSPASDGLPRTIYDRAGGREHTGIALPGGHGENYRVLASIYRRLRDRGIRWAYLGNVDNSGYTIDPVAVALTALTGAQASFEFSRRTVVDVKGGVLALGGAIAPDATSPDAARKGADRFVVAEIGQAISRDELNAEERTGKQALFNCATGLYDLDYLVPQIEYISNALPIRVSEQDKQLGRYAQAEQNTWEILGLLDKPLVLAVAKTRRFIAAKTLMETLIASPVSAVLEGAAAVSPELRVNAASLRAALAEALEREYGLDPNGRSLVD